MNKKTDTPSVEFLQDRIASLKRELSKCKQISSARKNKNLNLINEIRKLRKLLVEIRVNKT